MPSSSTHDSKIDFDSKEHENLVERNSTQNTSLSCQQNNNSCSSQKCPQSSSTESGSTNYTRNSSTTRSWPVIHRNISQISPHQINPNFLEPNFTSSNTKTEHLQIKAEQQKRKSTHQYDFDQIFGLNNSNYQQYLTAQKKTDNLDCIRDKSPSFYDMQNHHNPENSQQTQISGFCNTPPIIIFLLITLIMTTSATSMLCAAFLTGNNYFDKT